MKSSARVFLLATMMTTGPCYAVDMGLRPDQFGDASTRASERQGGHIDWGKSECGEPKYLNGVCVWSLSKDFDLTAHALNKNQPDKARWAVMRWTHQGNTPVFETQIFDKLCRSVIGAAKPQWSTQKIASLTKKILGNMKKDTETRTEGLLFMFNVWPNSFTCEVQDEG